MLSLITMLLISCSTDDLNAPLPNRLSNPVKVAPQAVPRAIQEYRNPPDWIESAFKDPILRIIVLQLAVSLPKHDRPLFYEFSILSKKEITLEQRNSLIVLLKSPNTFYSDEHLGGAPGYGIIINKEHGSIEMRFDPIGCSVVEISPISRKGLISPKGSMALQKFFVGLFNGSA
jgi:hypothetical protein